MGGIGAGMWLGLHGGDSLFSLLALVFFSQFEVSVGFSCLVDSYSPCCSVLPFGGDDVGLLEIGADVTLVALLLSSRVHWPVGTASG